VAEEHCNEMFRGVLKFKQYHNKGHYSSSTSVILITLTHHLWPPLNNPLASIIINVDRGIKDDLVARNFLVGRPEA